jgi:hypothetical protein
VILYFDHQIPRPDEDAGSLRAHGLLRILRALGHSISVCADEANPRPHHLQQLRELDITVVPGGELHEHLADATRRPDLVIIARVSVAVRVLPIVRAHFPGVPVIFDTVDLHYRRLGREAALRRDLSASLRALAVKVEELEMARAVKAQGYPMVLNIVLVHLIGMLGTQLFWGANPRAPIGG